MNLQAFIQLPKANQNVQSSPPHKRAGRISSFYRRELYLQLPKRQI